MVEGFVSAPSLIRGFKEWTPIYTEMLGGNMYRIYIDPKKYEWKEIGNLLYIRRKGLWRKKDGSKKLSGNKETV